MVVFNASTSPMKEGYAVSDSNVIKLAQPGVFTDSLTEVLRSGARALLTQAVDFGRVISVYMLCLMDCLTQRQCQDSKDWTCR